jgi:hypothetical protein
LAEGSSLDASSVDLITVWVYSFWRFLPQCRLDSRLLSHESGRKPATVEGLTCSAEHADLRDVPFIVIYVLYNGLRENIIY